MSYVIVDLDGTLVLEDEKPNQQLIDFTNALVMQGGTELIVVSARSIDRLESTLAWLQENKVVGVEQVYLNDFEGTPFATGLEFKTFKVGKLLEDGDEIAYAIDNDPEVRAAYEELGVPTYSPLEATQLQRAPVEGTDKFTTEGEAADRAKSIGCEGTHSMNENGQTIYMPCATHAAYDAIVNGEGDAPAYRAPAPAADQITGSDTNEPGSAKGKLGDIELTPAIESGLQTKADDHNLAMKTEGKPDYTRVRVDSLRAVFRRGAGAFSTSHRPGIGRNQWAMARVNAFLYLAKTGAPKNPNYIGDNDLLNTDHPRYAEAAEKNSVRVSVKVPAYISDAAARGLEFYEQGLAGDGLQPQTVTEAKQLAAGTVQTDKVQRLAAWVARHRSDWEGVAQNSDPNHPDWPGAGAVAGLLWGVPVSEAGAADRVTEWANGVVESVEGEDMPTRTDRREFETRGIPVGDYTVVDTADGQRTVTFYSALFDQPSQGLPFTESIAPGAFKRAIGQALQGRRIVKLLHNHDEGRMLASTASGRMVLEEDARGLKVTAQVDPADPDGAKIISLLKREAAAMSASFGFYIPKGGDSWDTDGNRRITEASLVECSLLSGATAAYPSTQGLATVRKVAAQKIGVDADTLMTTFERVKAGELLSEDDAKVLDTVRLKLGPKPARVIHPSVAEAQLKLQRLTSENQ